MRWITRAPATIEEIEELLNAELDFTPAPTPDMPFPPPILIMVVFLSVLLSYGLKKAKKGRTDLRQEDPKGDDSG